MVNNVTEEMWKEEGWALLTVIFRHLRQVLLPLYAFVTDRGSFNFHSSGRDLGFDSLCGRAIGPHILNLVIRLA